MACSHETYIFAWRIRQTNPLRILLINPFVLCRASCWQTVAQGRVQVVRNLHVLGRELDFWGDLIGVLKRISARNLKNTLKLPKNVILRSKTTIFDKSVLLKKRCVFSEPFPLFKGPGRAHMGPYGPIWALMGPYGPEESKKYVNNSPL